MISIAATHPSGYKWAFKVTSENLVFIAEDKRRNVSSRKASKTTHKHNTLLQFFFYPDFLFMT